MKHSHSWQVVSRVKRGAVIEVTERCSVCGATQTYTEAT